MRTQSAACRSSRSRLRIFFSCSMGRDVVYVGGMVGGRGPWCGPVIVYSRLVYFTHLVEVAGWCREQTYCYKLPFPAEGFHRRSRLTRSRL